MTCWLLNRKLQIQWDKQQERPLSKTRQQINVVLKSSILQNQILPGEFPFTHDNSFQVSLRNFPVLLRRSQYFCLHRNLSVALMSVKHLDSKLPENRAVLFTTLYPELVTSHLFHYWVSKCLNKRLCLKEKDPFLFSFFLFWFFWALASAWHIRCPVSEKWGQLPMFCY